MDERRKQFDFWAQDYYGDAWVHLCERTKASLFDCYLDAWQVSRQALVVELPKGDFAAWVSGDMIDGYKAAIADVVGLLDAAGVNHK